MAKFKAIFFPVIIGNLVAYLQNVYDKLSGGLAAKYGTAAGFMTSLSGWITSLTAAINKAEADAATAQASTKSRDELIDLIHTKVFNELSRIQKEDNFDEQDMEDLGARKDHLPPDPNKAKPKITFTTITVNKVILDWIKGPWEGVIIYGSYDGVTWKEIGHDLKSPWEDERPNQVAGTPETRHYKMVYMKDNKPMGLESDGTRAVVNFATA